MNKLLKEIILSGALLTTGIAIGYPLAKRHLKRDQEMEHQIDMQQLKIDSLINVIDEFHKLEYPRPRGHMAYLPSTVSFN